MGQRKHFNYGNLIFTTAFLLAPGAVFAYLDPGSGAVLVNLLIAGAATLLYSIKGVFLRLMGHKELPQSKNSPIKITLFSEGKQYWTSFQPLLEALNQHQIHFRYLSLDIEDPALAYKSDYMEARFLGYGALAYYRISTLRSEILISTTPNLGCSGYPIKRSARVHELIHIFHSVADLSMYRTGSLDHYDTVFMVGDFQAESIRQIEAARKLPAKKIISLGLPYLDVLKRSVKPMANEQMTILIASSWGEKGLFKAYGSGFIHELCQQGYRVIMRPHPQSAISEPDLVPRLQKEFKHHTRLSWDTSISPSTAMNQADLLISDTSSIRFDFAFMYEKPVITLEIPQQSMPGFEREYLSAAWTDLASPEIGLVLNHKDLVGGICRFIEQAGQEFNPMRIKAFRTKCLVNYGCASQKIAQYLLDTYHV